MKKVLRADDLLAIDAQTKPAPDGIINQRDLGSRKSKSKGVVAEEDLKSEAMDMEIDLEIDDLPPRKLIADYYMDE